MAPFVVGVTGGIGSGKTTVCKVFKAMGVPYYSADLAARELINSNTEVKTAIKKQFGEHLYSDGALNRPAMAEIVFNQPEKLKQLNAIVHPAVGKHFGKWCAQQNAHYVLKEAAILMESGSYKSCDAVLLVRAPEQMRIARVMQRDAIDATAVRARMANQWSEEKKLPFATHQIHNDNAQLVIPQALALHNQFIAACGVNG